MRRVLAATVLLAAAVSGCGGDGSASEPRRVVVLAAASLTDVLGQLAREHEDAHPGVDVVVSTGASSALAQQVVAGAPADLLAAASPAAMAVVTAAGEADGEPVVVARNALQIAVPRGNPGRVRGLADLADPARAVALCAEQVPCGDAARRAFAAAGLAPAADTLEQDVRAVLAKVRLGEVDAGLVYVTDVRSADGEVEGLAFPEARAAVNDYPAAVLRGGDEPEQARLLLELLLSARGQEVLRAAGFAPPP